MSDKNSQVNYCSNKLFAGKDWLDSQGPFLIPSKVYEEIRKLGRVFKKFYEACDQLYLRSVQGRAPAYIAKWLDLGKPEWIISHARHDSQRGKIPRVIRPDLLLSEDQLTLTELDSVPGGIGLTAALQEKFRVDHPQSDTGQGMLDAWRRIFKDHDVIISREAADYRPEMEWLARHTPPQQVFSAEDYIPGDKPVYRFVECFDLANMPQHEKWLRAAESGLDFTPPFRPHLEEKLWLALLWLQPLEDQWRALLGDAYFRTMRQITPRSWIVCPDELPPHAVLPGLEVNSWQEVKKFSQKRRKLVLKPSGFSPLAWGARGVVVGHDVSLTDWATAIDNALRAFFTTPHILQEFRSASIMQIAYIARDGSSSSMAARIRLCPYYFVQGDETVLAGILVTACPADKKIIHGMRDSILTIAQLATQPK